MARTKHLKPERSGYSTSLLSGLVSRKLQLLFVSLGTGDNVSTKGGQIDLALAIK